MEASYEPEQTAVIENMYSTNYQRQVLKLLCTNVQFVAQHGSLVQEEYFENSALRLLTSIIKRYAMTYEKELDKSSLLIMIDEHCNSHGVTAEVAKAIRHEASSIFLTHIKSENFVTDQLLKFIRRQELKNALLQSVDIIQKDDSYEKILGLIDKAVSIGSGQDDGMKFEDLYDLPKVYSKMYDRSKIVTTGLDTYDKCLLGGMAPGEVHVIMAPPKTGKSSFGCLVGAMNVKRQKNVFHITLELKKEDIAAKYAQILTRMNMNDICEEATDVYEKRIRKYELIKPYLFINYWTEKTINTLTIRSWISRIRAKTGVSPDLIIVDYDDLLLPTMGVSDSMYENSGNVYSDLKALADYFKVPILTFAQPQREGWTSPGMGNLIGAHQLAHSAKKAHNCFSVSSLNFEGESADGTLFVDIVRRGESKIKIPIRKDLSKSLFWEP